MFYDIEKRRTIEINTDPQRRCYNGCHYKSELVKTNWETLEINVKDRDINERLKFWRDLNDYAVSQRGKDAYVEYRKVAVE